MATLPRAKKKKRMAKTPDDASPFVASGEGTLPERGRDSENAARSRPRTSLGDGVVKPGGRRIKWAQLLRRVDWVNAGITMITIPREAMNTPTTSGGNACPVGIEPGPLQVSEVGDSQSTVAPRARLDAPTAPAERAASWPPDQGERPVLTHDPGGWSRSVLPPRCHAKRSSCAVEGRGVPSDGTFNGTKPRETRAMRWFWASCRSMRFVMGPRRQSLRGGEGACPRRGNQGSIAKAVCVCSAPMFTR
jgi:hypothetical protein